MPLAKEVAAELRRFADRLDEQPDAEIEKPLISVGSDNKERFLNSAALMLRPFTKKFDDFCGKPSIQLDYDSGIIRIWALAPRETACRVIRPAVPAEYDCEPLLSEAEEESLTSAS